MKLNRTDTMYDREARNKENENWTTIENNFNNVVETVSNKAYGEVVDAAKLNWKEPVAGVNNLPTTANEGDTMMTRDTGKVYRYNGTEFKEIQQIDAGPVNEVDNRLTSQLAETAKQVEERTTVINNVILDKTYENRSSYGTGELLQKPSWFSWDAPINIYKDGGRYFTDFDVSEFEPTITGQTYYVDPINGNDSNDGLSLESALKTPFSAVRKTDVGEVLISTGIVTRTELPSSNISGDISIKALPGADVVFSCHDDLSWSLADGMTNTYQTDRSSADWVWDARFIDQDGDNARLISRSSIDEVEANAGSYFINGNMVYVHAQDSRSLIGDKDIRVYLGTYNITYDGGRTLYFENIRFEGGRWYVRNTSSDLSPLVLAKGCHWKYMHGNQPGGLELVGGDAYLQNCVAAKNRADGFNYHIGNGRTNKVIEIDCVGRDNGNRPLPIHSDNGSTMHDGGQIIRLNGAYYRNEGPNVADVNDDTQSWNSGCIGLESRSDINGADFRARDNMMMRLEGCITDNPTGIESEAGATIEPYDVMTNAEVVTVNPMSVNVPSLIAGVVNLLNSNIKSVNQQIPGIQSDINDLRTKTVHSSGANANGQWIRFQDGTQIAVTGLISLNGETFVAEGALYRSSNSFTVTFPNDFVGASYQVMVVPRRLGGSGADNRVWATMYAANSFMLYKTNDTALTDCGYVATIIGRWK